MLVSTMQQSESTMHTPIFLDFFSFKLHELARKSSLAYTGNCITWISSFIYSINGVQSQSPEFTHPHPLFPLVSLPLVSKSVSYNDHLYHFHRFPAISVCIIIWVFFFLTLYDGSGPIHAFTNNHHRLLVRNHTNKQENWRADNHWVKKLEFDISILDCRLDSIES